MRRKTWPDSPSLCLRQYGCSPSLRLDTNTPRSMLHGSHQYQTGSGCEKLPSFYGLWRTTPRGSPLRCWEYADDGLASHSEPDKNKRLADWLEQRKITVFWYCRIDGIKLFEKIDSRPFFMVNVCFNRISQMIDCFGYKQNTYSCRYVSITRFLHTWLVS